MEVIVEEVVVSDTIVAKAIPDTTSTRTTTLAIEDLILGTYSEVGVDDRVFERRENG